MDVELPNPSLNLEACRHTQMWALLETCPKISEILAHDIVENEDACKTVEIHEDPVDDVVHVSLAKLTVSMADIRPTTICLYAPLSLLEVDAGMRSEEPMS